jgi:hypothetical protein
MHSRKKYFLFILHRNRGRGSAVGIAMGYGLDGRGLNSAKDEIILFTITSTPAPEPTQPPMQWVPGTRSPTVKPQERESDHTPASIAEVKMVELYVQSPIRLQGTVLN